MTKFGSLADRDAIENEMPWEKRPVPRTMYDFVSRAAEKFGSQPGVTFQLLSGPKDPAETLSWREFHLKVTQAANMFRALGVGESDVVALVMPNSNETNIAMIGAMIAGIANPINPLLEPMQIAAIMRETKAKVVVTLKSFPKTDVAQKVAEALTEAPCVETVLEVDLNRYLTPPKS